MFYTLPLSRWDGSTTRGATAHETLQAAYDAGSDGTDPDVILNDDGTLACLAGLDLGAGACGCPKCEAA